MNKFIKICAISLTAIGVLILLVFLKKTSLDGYSIFSRTDYSVTGQFGDFVGGVVGTFFALSGTLLIFLSFIQQSNENKRISFESSFFEMIRLHRENISELRYNKYKSGKTEEYHNRQVISLIFKEFIECYRDVKKFSNSRNIDDYILPKYKRHLEKIINKINPEIDLIEMVIIDISWSITFYGLSVDGESVIRKAFLKKYNQHYYSRLLFYIKLKPKKTNVRRHNNWILLRGLPLNELHPLIEELYNNRKNPRDTIGLSGRAISLKVYLTYEKYYGGHQFRLGHYFRHLFQSFTFVNTNRDLNPEQKYFYAKLLRAQLSTYEQSLLFVNSISTLGMKWELNPEKKASLITAYNLIKNLPGEHIYGIKYKKYYPNVDYEFDEQLKF
ncbi:MAG: hypothetical protein BM557_06475 [Flavobacterium sp. MedPE-SWcel]|uniref:putative phage abortive infection protein n=1 Tax=uncultured Flavobacterium sp. TaxID=165435 RepID=UPI0009172DE8|nr:putative phage abortive infection protein [uncultured Flavobacterium sp.]OIQ19345.1 MAG: hypothetical protein BM557_06475 [Flavobacterium sp. MedPE-SWcel]